MPVFTGRFEFLEPGRGAVRSGACEFQFDERTATIVADGPPLAFDLGDIDTFAAGEYDIRLSLFDGHDVVLTRFAKGFQDLERQLREAYRDRLVRCLLVGDTDEMARFTGRVELESPSRRCSGPAEIRLYENHIAVLPDAAPGFQWRLSGIDRVEFDEAGYAVVVEQAGERLRVGRLAKRTGELADSLRARMRVLAQRSAHVLHGVFPFLSPEPFSRLAGLMREGTSVSIASVGPLHDLVEPVLLGQVVGASLKPYLAALAGRAAAPWFAGFTIVRKDADPAADAGDPPSEEDDDSLAEGAATQAAEDGSAPEDEAGAGLSALDVGDGLEALFWFFFPLAAAGGRPTHVAWEATSRGGRATYLFRLDPSQSLDVGVAAINRGLLALNFRREPVYLDQRTLETTARYRPYVIAQRKLPDLGRVRASFAGRAIHTTPAAWLRQLDGLLAR
jgi:hypothetical protein